MTSQVVTRLFSGSEGESEALIRTQGRTCFKGITFHWIVYTVHQYVTSTFLYSINHSSMHDYRAPCDVRAWLQRTKMEHIPRSLHHARQCGTKLLYSTFPSKHEERSKSSRNEDTHHNPTKLRIFIPRTF